MARHIVVAFDMPPAGMTPGPEGPYLTRARSMCARGEALGGRLVAWSAALVAMAWDCDSVEEALLLAASVREESLSPERAWSSGVSEGELEALAPDGARMHLAWGEALVSAAALAHVARPGEVLIDGDLRAVHAGQLNLLGPGAASDAVQGGCGWRLDVDHPWKPGPDPGAAGADATDRYLVLPPQDDAADTHLDEGAVQDTAVVDFTTEELSTSEVLQIVAASAEADAASFRGAEPRPGRLLAERVRKLAGGDVSADAIEALAELRRARTRAEGRPAASRCQAALALAMTLGIAGRPEEALLEALDALARAREAREPKAVVACMALLAKLYSFAGLSGEASALRECCGA
jgi:hypothetical protein